MAPDFDGFDTLLGLSAMKTSGNSRIRGACWPVRARGPRIYGPMGVPTLVAEMKSRTSGRLARVLPCLATFNRYLLTLPQSLMTTLAEVLPEREPTSSIALITS